MRLTSTFLLLSISHIFGQTSPPAAWTATSPMIEARDSSCAVRLTEGRILVTGGKGINGDLASTEFYLGEGAFLPGPQMNLPRSSHTCTLLNDGRILVAGGDAAEQDAAGGDNGGDPDAVGSAEIFDPIAGTWQLIAGTGTTRRSHTATLLPDGQVLLAGGDGADGPLASIEFFDPQSNSLISSDPALLEARSQHSAVLLPDGRVMLVGGQGASGPLASTEIFDPRDFSLVAGPALSTARVGHSAILLDDGRVLAAGGFDGNQELDTAEILPPGADAWTKLDAHLNTARRDHFSILIPGNGGVLIAGGLQNGVPLGATELFLPVENTFLALGPLTLARSRVAVAPIDSGVILAVGGRTADGPQSACGVLTVPAIRFDKTVYHIPETATATLSSFPASAKVNFSLSMAPGSNIVAANDRLLTSSVTVAANSTSNIPVVLTRLQDAGLTARLTATAPSSITAVVTTQIRNATALTLSLPGGVYEGSNVNLVALLNRAASNGTMTGTLSLGASTTSGGTTTVVNTTSNVATVQKPLTNLAPGSVVVSANYSGDVANDAASASGNFSVVSRTPRVQLFSDVVSAQAGVFFGVSAFAHTDGTVTSPQRLTGTLNILESGFPVHSDIDITTLNSFDNSFMTVIIPLTLNPIVLNATYSGDSFFHDATSPTVTINVQKAPTALTIDPSPATYTCGQPSSFSVTLSYPVSLGLSNKFVTLQGRRQDGSLETLVAGNLTVNPPGPLSTLNRATATVSGFLPLDISNISANFTGDPLLSDATSSPVNPTYQKLLAAVALTSPGTLTNPATLTASVSAASCNVPPTGSVEFLDNGATLAAVSLKPASIPGSQVLPFPSSSNATLSGVSRPPGVHNLSVRYSGDAHYQASTSPVIAVAFQ